MNKQDFLKDLLLLSLSVVYYTSWNNLFSWYLGTLSGICGLTFVLLILYMSNGGGK